MAVEITGTGRAVPSRRVTNDDLAGKIETSDEWIRSHTGIGARYFAGDDTATSDLALEAAKKALSSAAGLDELTGEALAEAALSLDMIIVASATPDFIGSPSTACLVLNKLQAKKAGAMDIGAGCTGFICALETAAGLLSLGSRKRILIIGAETLSKFIDWTDRGSCVLFGDGAGAAILENTSSPCEGSGRKGLIRTILRAEGSGEEYLFFPRGGSRNPIKAGETIDKPIHIYMDGLAVYNFAVEAMSEIITDMLSLEGLSINDIKWIIPHQANARIIRTTARRLKIPEKKFYLNIERYANTSAASIPIALDELNRNGEINPGEMILTVGFGSGLTYGSNLIVW